VLFLTPWQGVTLAGTTDVGIPEAIDDPKPPSEDVDFILREIAPYVNLPVSRKDVLSAWYARYAMAWPTPVDALQALTRQLVRGSGW
jgi:glycerol-3-phosphate dehydrogenase